MYCLEAVLLILWLEALGSFYKHVEMQDNTNTFIEMMFLIVWEANGEKKHM